ncbi:nucleotide disphospho-sugar-binding domain-containing protein [Gandjariella thermophila]|uniref:Glycosyl transferase n=1 Tax=Gandjariella thermophila TaxID=1931992 RepID=A0A4D4J977_9PSEU|nr:nucleotide disphospho-sugar-binding domain-containing protein [Gandjariella thermophila]GDY31046.1 glycosyl transferase [Gandjariella thermophila]
MRVVFTTWAWPTHLYALAPLAWACRAAGHDVLFASQPGLLGDILRAGLPAATVGTDVDTAGMVREYLLPTGGGRAAGNGGRPRAVRMLLAHAESMVDDLVELVGDWRADLVVYHPTALAGPLAAAAAGVPAVRHLYGADLLGPVSAVLTEAFAPLADRCGGTGFDPCGVATVDPVPASMQVTGDHRRLPIRYVPFNGPAVLPVGLPTAGDRPRVCVSWGHTIARVEPHRFPVNRVVAAAADLDVEVVLAVSAAQRPLLAPLPDGVRVLVDKPLQHVLAGCDLLVGHGGASSILTALLGGVPLLLVPQLPDHAGHAARVAARGAGLVLGIGEAEPAVLREAIGRLVAGDAPERAAARAVAAEMRGQPPATSVVAALESLRASHHPRSAVEPAPSGCCEPAVPGNGSEERER